MGEFSRREKNPVRIRKASWDRMLLLLSPSVMSDSLQPHGLQHARLPCPSLAPGVCSNSYVSWVMMPSNHLILYCPLLLLASIFPSIRVFSWVSLDCKEIKVVNPKENQSWIFIGRTDAEGEAPILWPLDAKNWLIRKDPDVGDGQGSLPCSPWCCKELDMTWAIELNW